MALTPLKIKLQPAETTNPLASFGDLFQIVTDDSWNFLLSMSEEGWILSDQEKRRLQIDFDQPGADYHRRQPRGKQELIARALGSRHGVKKILDLSAGLGQDAVSLCQLGFSVTAVERNPLLAFLLLEAKKRTTRPELANLTILSGDAKKILRQNDSISKFEAVYFDPMYPLKKKSALPRQEMVLFRSLVGDDTDAEEILKLALSSGIQRVVVKRPLGAPDLLSGVLHSFKGNTVRYDIYTGSV